MEQLDKIPTLSFQNNPGSSNRWLMHYVLVSEPGVEVDVRLEIDNSFNGESWDSYKIF